MTGVSPLTRVRRARPHGAPAWTGRPASTSRCSGESESGSPMQWRDATVGGRDTTGHGLSGSDAAPQKPDLRHIQAGYAGQHWSLTPGGAAARGEVGRADQLVAIGSGTVLTVGSDPPCTQD